MTGRWLGRAIAIATVLAMQAQPAFAYLEFGVTAGGNQVKLRWPQAAVRYLVTNAAVPNVTVADFQAALGRAFASWEAVPTASITYQFGGLTAAVPGRDDGLTTLGFQNRPDLDRVLAATNFVVDAATGALVE
jgi:hypothetical protein